MAMQVIHMVQGNVVITVMVQIKRCFLVTDKKTELKSSVGLVWTQQIRSLKVRIFTFFV
jgi:hypothetical protein